jgi:ABC-type polysaccharide/polyol phosphate transport system ATPase subunit
MNTVIKFENVSKKYKLYSKGGLYLRDRISHALGRLIPLNGHKPSAPSPEPASTSSHPLALGSPHALERDFWALKNISFEIKQGESVGFIGRNGAGKSTILKLLAGVTKPSNGTMEVNGRVAALIEVGAGFHPELTGRENIYLNGSILGMKKVEIEHQFDSIVAYAELEDFIDTPVKHYSSGMYVRLGFAIAAHTNPDIFLIDEVLAVGDESFQKKCLATLEAHKEAGKTMILVTHSLDKVEEVCGRCVYMNQGEVGYDGDPVPAIKQYRLDVQNLRRETTSTNQDFQPKVEITEVVFWNTSGEEISTLNTGDDLIIEIRYRARERIDNPAVGVLLTESSDVAVTGFNNRTTSVKLDALEGEGSVYCRLQNIPFRDGLYRVRAAISDYACEKTYDAFSAIQRIKIECAARYTYGLVRYSADWSQAGPCPWFESNQTGRDARRAKAAK